MNRGLKRNLLIATLLLIFIMLMFASATAASNPQPKYIYYQVEENDTLVWVRADYMQAVDDLLDDDSTLRDAIAEAILNAIGAGRNVYVEDEDGNVINYTKANRDNVRYPDAADDFDEYGVEAAPEAEKELVVDPDNGKAVLRPITEILEYEVTFEEANELEGVEITVSSNGAEASSLAEKLQVSTAEEIDTITTDADGKATTTLPDGEYTYTATKDDYEEHADAFEVDGEDKIVSFTMGLLELEVTSVEAITTTDVTVEFKELTEDVTTTVNVIDPDGVTHPVEEKGLAEGATGATFDFVDALDSVMAGEWTVNGLPYLVFEETVTGELTRIYDDGARIRIDGDIYDVAAMPQFRGYLSNMSAADHMILGSQVTVAMENDEVVDIEEIVLEDKEYDHRSINDMIDHNVFYRMTLKGSEGTKISGNVVRAAMDHLTVQGITFTNYDVVITGDYVTIKDSTMEDIEGLTVGETTISDAFAFDADLDEVGGDVSIAAGRDVSIAVHGDIDGDVEINDLDATVTAGNNITGDVSINDDRAEVTANNNIEGDVTINADDATLNAVTVEGDLMIAGGGTNATLNIDEAVEGSVTLNESADIDGLDIGENLIVNNAGIVLNDLTVGGYVEFGSNTDEVEITNSEFGHLSDNNSGNADNITFENVVFYNLYQDLISNTQTDLEDTDTFTINAGDGWTFYNVTWPADVDEFDINILADETHINNTAVSGDLDITADDVAVSETTVEGETDLDGDDAVFTNVIFEDEVDLNSSDAPSFIGGELQHSVLNIGYDTAFEGVTFNFNSSETVAVLVDEDGVSFENNVFMGAVDVEVDLVANEGTTFEGDIFEDESSFKLLSTSANDADVYMTDVEFADETAFELESGNETDFTADGMVFGGEVVIALESDAEGFTTFNNTTFEYDEVADEELEIPAASDEEVRFDEGTVIYRPVVIDAGAEKVRFFDTTFYNNMTVDNPDTRINNSTFNTEMDDIEIDGADRAVLNNVDFVGENDVDITVANLALRGTVTGNNIVTVDTQDDNVDYGLESTITGMDFADATNDYTVDNRNVTLEDVEFSDAGAIVILPELDATLINVEVGNILRVNGDDAELTNVVVGNNLRIWGNNADLTDVDVGNDLNINLDNNYTLNWDGGDVNNLNRIVERAGQVITLDNLTINTVAADAIKEGAYTLTFNGCTFETAINLANILDGQIDNLNLTFNEVTFEGNLSLGDAATANEGAVFSDITIDEAEFNANDSQGDAAHIINIVDGEITDLASNGNYEELTFTGVTFTTMTALNIDFEAEFTECVFDVVVELTASEADAVFESNIFEGTVTTGTDEIVFNNDTFQNDVTVDHNDIVFNGAHFDAVGLDEDMDISLDSAGDYYHFNDVTFTSGDYDINVDFDQNNLRVTMEVATFVEAGDGKTVITLSDDSELKLVGEINWEDAENLEINASEPTATVNDADATWVPEVDIPVIQVL